jgi:3-methyl-2-oxobutanoate hydroxymethyltransferase
MSTESSSKPISLQTFRNHKAKSQKFAALTSYEATITSMMCEAGIELILVGDSLGMVIQGHDSTVPVSMEDILYHLRCVKSGNKGAHLMADMPFMSYATEQLAYENATRLMQAGANSVKVEGGEVILKTTELLSQRGIPVCAHMGLTPQSINRIGGFFVQGRDPSSHSKMIEEAKSLENAGAELLLLECIPVDLTKKISDALSIPTIGIGAGSYTDAQIMVIHDMLGIKTLPKQPKFVKNFLAESNSIAEALEAYVEAVKSVSFPSQEHWFE